MKAKDALAEAQRTFRTGGYSGHPEEQLELIEDCQHRLDLITRAVSENRALDWAEIDAARQALVEHRHGRPDVPFGELPQSYFDEFDRLADRIDASWKSDLRAGAAA